jgi:hypothetical protein
VRYVFIPVLPHCIKLYLLMKDSRNLEKYWIASLKNLLIVLSFLF